MKDVPANTTFNGDFWIPWATNADEYSRHRAEIRLDGKPLFYFWQHGTDVRFRTRNEFNATAPPAPGYSKSGGDRTLYIEIVNNTPIFVISNN